MCKLSSVVWDGLWERVFNVDSKMGSEGHRVGVSDDRDVWHFMYISVLSVLEPIFPAQSLVQSLSASRKSSIVRSYSILLL
jgi:hypothetical protein